MYARPDNFVGRVLYTDLHHAYLLPETARALRKETQREEEKEKEKTHVHGDKVTFFRAMEKAVVTNWLSLRTCSVFSPFLSFPQRLPPDGW